MICTLTARRLKPGAYDAFRLHGIRVTPLRRRSSAGTPSTTFGT